jgi:hypothetical protein
MDTNSPAEPPQLPVKTASVQDAETRRRTSISDRTTHTKKLSLNFPVLLPSHTNGVSQSPNTLTPISPARSSPRTIASPAVEAPDFLTLLAGQERKVFELREELSKAETELLALKKQWASFEASKKKSELRQIAKLQPLPSGAGKDDSETERERQRILEQTSGKPRRHTSQRVFSNSRHARQLSLLSPTASEKPPIRHSLDSSIPPSKTKINEPSTHSPASEPASVPTPSIESPATLGKTYRDLASRNSLPPPSTDAIVRQGKQMASDLKDGLWTFFEDIRQATVGEEAITGIQGENGRPKMAKRSSNTLHRKKRFSKENSHIHPSTHENPEDDAATPTSNPSSKDTSFWREFGIETPHKRSEKHIHDTTNINTNTNTTRQVSDPLLDLDDEAWEAWESPHPNPNPNSNPAPLKTTSPNHSASQSHSQQSHTQMPWPELSKRLTPARMTMTRTVSDMMKEWDADPKGITTGKGMAQEQAGLDHHVLTSPHM